MTSPAIGCSTYKAPFSTRITTIERLNSFLEHSSDDVLDILTDISSYSASQAELKAAMGALRGAAREVASHKPPRVGQMSVFMPSNVILYSYVLYLVIPSLYVESIRFRPASCVLTQLTRLHALLQCVHRLPLHLERSSQRQFVADSARQANVVVFTGAYKNAETIRSQLDNSQMFVFFGQGVNPFVVSETAHLQGALRDLVSIRMLNTGQDCMGPDAIFVHQSLVEEFVGSLADRLQQLKFGSSKDPAADYCPIYYPSTLELISKYLMSNQRFIRFGGLIDYARARIEPTILASSLTDRADITEFFGPVFNLVSYRDEPSLARELGKPFYRERAMGATVYAADQGGTLSDLLSVHHMVSVNSTLLEVEDGNSPFGGHGRMANYVSHNCKTTTHPILLSKEVADNL